MDVQISKSQIQEDLKKIETRRNEIDTELQKLQLEKEQLQERERVLAGVLEMYFCNGTRKNSTDFSFSLKDWNNLGIAETCIIILKNFKNKWLCQSDFLNEFQKHGKVVHPFSISVALKRNIERFEVKKEGKRKYFRLKNWRA